MLGALGDAPGDASASSSSALAAECMQSIRAFLQVYGESSVGREDGCTEASTLEPTNPYSAAKAGAGEAAPAACAPLPVLLCRPMLVRRAPGLCMP